MKCKHCSREAVPGRAYCQTCIDGKSGNRTANRKKWRAEGLCPECGAEPAPGIKLCPRCANRVARRKMKYHREVKLATLAHYSTGPVKCACPGGCAIDDPDFLTIDHINGGGNKHRQEVYGNFLIWLKVQGYPAGYRVLCFNCNIARGLYGSCPHERSGNRFADLFFPASDPG